MKKKGKFLPLILCGIILLTTGIILAFKPNVKAVKYSCNPEINEWAAENLSMIRSAKRTELLKLDPDRLRAALIAATPEQKSDFWKQKLETIEKTQQWSAEELEHLKILENSITTEMFTEEWHKNLKKMATSRDFNNAWTDKAVKKLGWSPNLVSAIILSPYNVTDKNGTLETWGVPNLSRLKKAVTESCNCVSLNYVSSTTYNGCGLLPNGSGIYRPCYQKGACSGVMGCGEFANWPCDGNCIP